MRIRSATQLLYACVLLHICAHFLFLNRTAFLDTVVKDRVFARRCRASDPSVSERLLF